ncbi:MAG: hypothetical protein ABR529_00530 [Actinomycetota bacterium]
MGGRSQLPSGLPACMIAAGIAAAILAAPGTTATAAVTRAAGPCEGSSNPTFLSNNRRMVMTAGGRLLAVYDPHGSGQQLVWKDPAGGWRTKTRGNVSNGFFPGDRNGDRPATIALARDGRGRQHAWVVWAGPDFSAHLLGVQMRRLSGLGSSGGPRVGPMVEIEPAGTRGNARTDLAFEKARGKRRGVVSWLRRDHDGSHELVVEWFTQLGTDRPKFHHRRSLITTNSARPTGALVATRRGVRLIATTPSGKLKMFKHRNKAPLKRWSATKARIKVPRKAIPSAVNLGRRGIFVALESSRNKNAVKVVRFPKGKRARVVLKARRHAQPTLTKVGNGASLIMIRGSDRRVVSRRFVPKRGWSRRDRVEIGPSAGGGYAWPNAIASSRRRVRFLVQGERCPTNPNSNAVLAYSRRT